MFLTQELTDNDIRISIASKDRWVHSVFVERLWHSVKYEHAYFHADKKLVEAKAKLVSYFVLQHATPASAPAS